MKQLIALFIFAGFASAQSATLPANWVGGGATYNQFTSPKASGWVSYAHYLGNGMYSFTSEDVTGVGGTLHTSARTGFAMVVKQLKGFTLLAIGDAGASVSTPITLVPLATKHATTDVSASFGPGGILVYRKKNFTVEAAYRKLVTQGQTSQNVYEAGIGFTF